MTPPDVTSLVVAHAHDLDRRLTCAVLAWSTGLVVAVAVTVAAL